MIKNICKNPLCKKEIFVITKSGKTPQHCSIACRYASPRGGRQYLEQPPSCKLEECSNIVSWNIDKRIWNKYCCIDCGKAGRSRNVSLTKKHTFDLLPKIDKRRIDKCAFHGCTNIAVIRRKKNVTHGYCSAGCRSRGLVYYQNRAFMRNYGVVRPAQNAECFDKGQKSGKKLRPYTFSDGTITYVRGYEPQALAKLEQMGYTSREIITDTTRMPKIIYEFEDKSCRYYPDIYIPSENRIIEVKSTYTYARYLDKNIAKKNAVEIFGIKMEFWIMDGKGNRLPV